jgi:hypothetical protein
MSEIENLTAQLEKVSKQLDNTASSADVKSLMEKQEQLAKQIADLEQKSVHEERSLYEVLGYECSHRNHA